MLKLKYQDIICERLRRQGLMESILSSDDEEAYVELFRVLQPVAPVHFTRPGDPPRLVHRTCFNDYRLSHQLREKHRIIKGRFQGGRVGYVLQEDLERYAVAFRKPMSKFKPIHEDIMDLIKKSGGMSKEQLKEELYYPSGEITKALTTLQEAFLVYEDQTDTDWDTGWFDFTTEWFDFKEDQEHYNQAVYEVILNFIKAMVFASPQQIKDWSQMNLKTLKQVLLELQDAGKIVPVEVDGVEGYIRAEDESGLDPAANVRSMFMLDKSDFLVRADMSALKDRYKGHEVLQYLLIDGEFNGAVLGHWRIGPYDIDDILVDLDQEEANARKEEIIDAVREIYSPEKTAILKYNGEGV
jgi:predicted transcriptional regulator